MELTLTLGIPILGAALVAGGIVAYRGSTEVRGRTLAAAAIAAGVAIWAIILYLTPVSVTGGSGPLSTTPDRQQVEESR